MQTDQRTFGKWLRTQRRARDWTQDQLARAVGCAQVTIRKLEADELVPSKNLAEIIADKLNVPSEARAAFVKFARSDKAPTPIAQPASGEPWRAPQRDNLPIALTSFVGREHELATARELLARARLVTFTGSGGVGKTRLALELATQVAPQFADGVWLIELAPLTDPALIVPTLAALFGLQERPDTALEKILHAFLRAKKLLLILDNCEHLIHACAQFADALLRACADVKILATSREALSIAGERAYRVPSLALAPTADLESLAQSEAIQLFIERARALKHDFALMPANASDLAQICHRLDGIPLALELAAARIPVFAPAQIVARLDDRFRLLTGGSRTALPRQQTLRAAIDWSYSLLSPVERLLFARLAVFAGGWTFDALEAVCAGDGIDADALLDLITQLVGKSLAMTGEVNGETRYHFLETLRQYAREKLFESERVEQWRDRHLDYFTRFAEDADARNAVDRLAREQDNIRLALDWALSAARIEPGLRIAAAMQKFWWTRGDWSEAYQRSRELLGAPHATPRTLARGRVLRAAAHIANRFGRYAESRALFEESIAIFRALGKAGRVWLEMALARLGYAVGFRDIHAGMNYARESLELSRESSNYNGLMAALDIMGIGSTALGDYVAARKYYDEYLERARAQNDRDAISIGLQHLGWIDLLNGDLAQAEKWLDQTTEYAQGAMGLAWQSALRGNLARLRGELDRAETLLVQAIDALQKLGDQSTTSDTIRNLGRLELTRRNFARAHQLFRDALTMQRDGEIWYWLPWSFENFALHASATNDFARAARLFGAAEALRETRGARLPPIDRDEYAPHLANLRAQLDAAQLRAAWDVGRALSIEQALEYALENKNLPGF
jgi:non-specific serine/threonine protein kinase